VVTCWSRST